MYNNGLPTAWVKDRSTNVSAAETAPTGSGFVSASLPSNAIPCEGAVGARMIFFGVATAPNTIVAGVYGVSTDNPVGTPTTWVTTLLATVTATTGTATGLNGSTLITSTDVICDGIAVAEGISGAFGASGGGTTSGIYNSVANDVGEALIYLYGSEYLFTKYTTIDGTDANSIIKLI